MTPKMDENEFEIICILMAAKNYTSNFSDTPFGHDHCTSSNAFLTASSNQPDFSMYFPKKSKFCHFFHFFKTNLF